MNLEMEVVTECNHNFVIDVPSVVEAPQPGASINCKICHRDTIIRKTGLPHRKGRENFQQDKNQTSIK